MPMRGVVGQVKPAFQRQRVIDRVRQPRKPGPIQSSELIGIRRFRLERLSLSTEILKWRGHPLLR